MAIRLSLLITATLLATAGGAQAQEPLLLEDVPLATTGLRATFVAVDLDEDTRRADTKLIENLNSMVSLVHFGLESRSYETVVEMLAEWNSRDPLVARLTPFVYLAAESLGADLVPLATYTYGRRDGDRYEDTGRTTYYSWFVVRKEDLESDKPRLQDVVELIEKRHREKNPIRFGYHSRLSTSSYFVPALFFLENNIFHVSERIDGTMLSIRSEKIDRESSSELVRRVAAGATVGGGENRQGLDQQATKTLDLAAVWDGTRDKFCKSRMEIRDNLWLCTWEGSELYFIRLPDELPNDLLVCSTLVGEQTRRQIANAIKLMDDIQIGDFGRWEEIGQAGRARAALADLLRRARQAPAPVTIDVRADPDSHPRVLAWQERAVQEAIELSGTEFTVWEREFHERRDFEWTLRLTHDGALEVTSVALGFPGGEDSKQVHIMSFQDTVDLIDRTTNFIASRMHRIRRIWPYWSRPTVIRDLPFALPHKGTRLKIAKIVWQDLEHNSYTIVNEDSFEGVVEESDFNKLHVAADDFPRTDAGEIDLDPMSNAWYRVLLLREDRESALLRGLTYTFVALLVLAAVAAVWDFGGLLRKGLQRTRGVPAETQTEEAHAS